MRKTTLSLTLILAGISVAKAESTPITTLPGEDDNMALYTISARDAARGVLYADVTAGKLATAGSTYTTLGGYSMYKDIAIDDADVQQQFALIAYDGEYYMYSPAAKKLCVKSNDTANAQPIALSDRRADAVTFATLTDNVTVPAGYYNISFGGVRMSFSNGSAHYGACRLDNSGDNDGGAFMQVAKITDATLTDVQYAIACNLIELSKVPSAVGYPSEAARDTYRSALSAATTVDEISAARTAFVASTDVILPENGHAYRIKAKYNDTTTPYRYIRWDASLSRLGVTTDEPGLEGIFYVKKHDDGTFAVFNFSNHQFLCYFSDSLNDLDGNKDGFASTFTNTDGKEAVLSFPHLTTQNHAQPNDMTELAFGTLAIQGKPNSGNNAYYLMAGDVNFHNAESTLVGYSNNRSSFFVFEEVEEPGFPTVAMSTLDITSIGDKVVAYVAPYASVIPGGINAYFISEAKAPANGLSRAGDNGTLVMKKLGESGSAIAANTPVILAGDTPNSNLFMVPATREALCTVPGGFNNLLQVAAAGSDGTATSGHVFNGSAFEHSEDIADDTVYLPGLEPTVAYKLDSSNVDTSIREIGAATSGRAAVYDLQGRRLAAPAKGLNIINGQKVLVR